ncbi:hypothetical protein METHPM2_1250009 [Pseudomonas sp. PM2]
MSLDLHSLAWHRSVGKLIMQLNRPEFWSSLIRVLNEYVQIDNWVVLVFGDHAVRVIAGSSICSILRRNCTGSATAFVFGSSAWRPSVSNLARCRKTLCA